MTVPIIDLFAGPGGLGEGFSQIGWREGNPFFRIGLSVEKDKAAHRTLKLRSFLRQFNYDDIPEEYYDYLRQGREPEELYSIEKYSEEANAADTEAWNDTLRDDDEFNVELDKRIKKALNERTDWVLIGGPPCQAYSLVGRSRNKGIKDYKPEKDDRHFLYQEYLRIIAVHRPAVFVMENVKGLLSAQINGNLVFDQIERDLRNPADDSDCCYRIFSLVKEPDGYDEKENPVFDKKDFVIAAEKYGIPQARHRVILLGVRNDIFSRGVRPTTLTRHDEIPVSTVLGLPQLRSGISRGNYDKNDWYSAVKAFPADELNDEICKLSGYSVRDSISYVLRDMSLPDEDMGADFVNSSPPRIDNKNLSKWYEDKRLRGVLNHKARTHMVSDLHRYLYAACFAETMSRSPKMNEFPEHLKPAHKNRDTGHFNDRFRVQISRRPSSTITSHISKDGHYYIHPDPKQCRSLTVREAARLQTFPDNYFFCGNRTQQYVQVGNAVPPLLAYKIAQIVKNLLTEVYE